MIVTTTPSVEGRRITEYKGVVFGEVIAGVNFVKDFVAGLSNFFGGRSGTYEEELINARQQALDEMEQRAAQLGADAVVGVDIDYEVLGADNGMLMVTASGTAVRLDCSAHINHIKLCAQAGLCPACAIFRRQAPRSLCNVIAKPVRTLASQSVILQKSAGTA